MKTTISLILLFSSLIISAHAIDTTITATATDDNSFYDQISKLDFKDKIKLLQKDIKEWNYDDYKQMLLGGYLPQGNFKVVPIIQKYATMGGDAGNGGGAYICKGVKKEIEYAQSVDLWEARELFNLNIAKDNRPAKLQALEKIDKLARIHPYFSQLLAIVMHEVFENLDIKVSKGIQDKYLAVVPDSLDLERPYSCPNSSAIPEYAQVINFTKDNEFKFDLRLYQALESETDRAALLVHESIYKLLRLTAKESNSKTSRKLVGYLFSDEPNSKLEDLLKDILIDSYFTHLDDAVSDEIQTLAAGCDANGLVTLINSRPIQLFDGINVSPRQYLIYTMQKIVNSPYTIPEEGGDDYMHGIEILISTALWQCKDEVATSDLVDAIDLMVPSTKKSAYIHRTIESFSRKNFNNITSATIEKLLSQYDVKNDSYAKNWNNLFTSLFSRFDSDEKLLVLESLLKNRKVIIDSTKFNLTLTELFVDHRTNRLNSETVMLFVKYHPEVLSTNETSISISYALNDNIGEFHKFIELLEGSEVNLNFENSFGDFLSRTYILTKNNKALFANEIIKSSCYHINYIKNDGNNTLHSLLLLEPKISIDDLTTLITSAKRAHPDQFKAAIKAKNRLQKTPLNILGDLYPVETFFRNGPIGELANLLDPNK